MQRRWGFSKRKCWLALRSSNPIDISYTLKLYVYIFICTYLVYIFYYICGRSSSRVYAPQCKTQGVLYREHLPERTVKHFELECTQTPGVWFASVWICTTPQIVWLSHNSRFISKSSLRNHRSVPHRDGVLGLVARWNFKKERPGGVTALVKNSPVNSPVEKCTEVNEASFAS